MKFPRMQFTVRRMMAVVGVMAVVFGVWVRREHFLEQARHYADASGTPCSEPPEAGTEAFQEWIGEQERQRRRVEHFDRLRLKYERAARYPWLPVAPDPPPPD
jgi:hypothetical protein